MLTQNETIIDKIKDDSYINWIEAFSIKTNKIHKHNFPKNILLNQLDIQNLKLMDCFYEEILNYIIATYDLPIESLYGCCVVINYNNTFYAFEGNENDVYCSKLSDFNSYKFIEYENFKNYVIEKNYALIKIKRIC